MGNYCCRAAQGINSLGVMRYGIYPRTGRKPRYAFEASYLRWVRSRKDADTPGNPGTRASDTE